MAATLTHHRLYYRHPSPPLQLPTSLPPQPRATTNKGQPTTHHLTPPLNPPTNPTTTTQPTSATPLNTHPKPQLRQVGDPTQHPPETRPSSPTPPNLNPHQKSDQTQHPRTHPKPHNNPRTKIFKTRNTTATHNPYPTKKRQQPRST